MIRPGAAPQKVMLASTAPMASLHGFAVQASEASELGAPSCCASFFGPNPLPHSVQTLGDAPTHPRMATPFTPNAEGAVAVSVIGSELLGMPSRVTCTVAGVPTGISQGI